MCMVLLNSVVPQLAKENGKFVGLPLVFPFSSGNMV